MKQQNILRAKALKAKKIHFPAKAIFPLQKTGGFVFWKQYASVLVWGICRQRLKNRYRISSCLCNFLILCKCFIARFDWKYEYNRNNLSFWVLTWIPDLLCNWKIFIHYIFYWVYVYVYMVGEWMVMHFLSCIRTVTGSGESCWDHSEFVVIYWRVWIC